jgi:hypothetical protein
MAALGIGAILVAALANARPAGAADFGQLTLDDLHQLCRDTDQGNQIACQYYILGIAEGTSAAANMAGDKAHFCIPDKLSGTSLVAVVAKSAEKDLSAFPKDASLPAVNFVSAVLLHEYPCAK